MIKFKLYTFKSVSDKSQITADKLLNKFTENLHWTQHSYTAIHHI